MILKNRHLKQMLNYLLTGDLRQCILYIVHRVVQFARHLTSMVTYLYIIIIVFSMHSDADFFGGMDRLINDLY